jgi:hypothetical protein
LEERGGGERKRGREREREGERGKRIEERGNEDGGIAR